MRLEFFGIAPSPSQVSGLNTRIKPKEVPKVPSMRCKKIFLGFPSTGPLSESRVRAALVRVQDFRCRPLYCCFNRRVRVALLELVSAPRFLRESSNYELQCLDNTQRIIMHDSGNALNGRIMFTVKLSSS